MTVFAEGGNILIQEGGRTLRLHSSRPEAEAEKQAASISPHADALLIIGVGCGWLLEKALSLPRLRYIFAVEPSPAIAALGEELRPTLASLKKDPRVIWISSPHGLSLRPYTFSQLALVVPRAYGEIFAKEAVAYQKIFADALSRKEISKNTLSRFGKLWVKNFFRNMPLYLNSVPLHSFLGWGKGKPALIIGAGPSLDQCLPHIKEKQNCALLFAADTALPMLEAAGICPDFVFSVDPQDINAFYLRYAAKKGCCLIADPGIHSSAFEGFSPQKIILCDGVFPFYQSFAPLWGERGAPASGGSVSTNAFDCARSLGCAPLILVGQDLSFTTRKSHGSGNILWELGRAKHNRLFPYHSAQARTMYPPAPLTLRGRRGECLLADLRLASFAGWFSEEIPKTQTSVYTAGMDGAFLQGACHKEIPEAFALLQEEIDKNFYPPALTPDSAPLQKYLLGLKKETESLLKQALKTQEQGRLGRTDRFFQESAALQAALSTSTGCTRIVEIGIQEGVWQALQAEEASFGSASALVDDIAQSLCFLLRQIHRALFLLKQKSPPSGQAS